MKNTVGVVFPILEPDMTVADLKREALSLFTLFASRAGWTLLAMPDIRHQPEQRQISLEAVVNTHGNTIRNFQI